MENKKLFRPFTVNSSVGLFTIAEYLVFNPDTAENGIFLLMNTTLVVLFAWSLIAILFNWTFQKPIRGFILSLLLCSIAWLEINQSLYRITLFVTKDVPREDVVALKKIFPPWPLGSVKVLSDKSFTNEKDAVVYLEEQKYRMLVWWDHKIENCKISTRKYYQQGTPFASFSGDYVHAPLQLYLGCANVQIKKRYHFFNAFDYYIKESYQDAYSELEKLGTQDLRIRFLQGLAIFSYEETIPYTNSFTRSRSIFESIIESPDTSADRREKIFRAYAYYYLNWIDSFNGVNPFEIESRFERLEQLFLHPMLLLNHAVYHAENGNYNEARKQIQKADLLAEIKGKKEKYRPFGQITETLVKCYEGSITQQEIKHAIDPVSPNQIKHWFVMAITEKLNRHDCLPEIDLD